MEMGIIFDMDGVIMDNNIFHVKAWAEFCHTHHIELNEEEFHSHVFGRLAKDTLEYIFGCVLTKAEIDLYVGEKEVIYRKIYGEAIHPLAGLMEFLADLRMRDIPMALATSAPPGNVAFTFQHIPVEKYFGFILDGDSVSRGKPDPEIYLKAIRMMKLPPHKCIVFEDSLAGIKAGLDAGAKVIGVTTTHTPDEMNGVSMTIGDFRKISFPALEKITGSPVP